MQTMQTLAEVRQLEPTKNLVESIPVQERKKLSTNKKPLESFQEFTWEDLRGLPFVLDED